VSKVLGSSRIPHGGGAVAILIAGIVCAVIAATVALEMRRNMVAWMVVTFVGTVLVIAASHTRADLMRPA
jgi:uncharacterized membrane protein YeaQ/YmgE (transglycosylase-associated protein family)